MDQSRQQQSKQQSFYGNFIDLSEQEKQAQIQLMKRLFDKGIYYQMPSVKRQKDHAFERMLTSKIAIENWQKQEKQNFENQKDPSFIQKPKLLPKIQKQSSQLNKTNQLIDEKEINKIGTYYMSKNLRQQITRKRASNSIQGISFNKEDTYNLLLPPSRQQVNRQTSKILEQLDMSQQYINVSQQTQQRSYLDNLYPPSQQLLQQSQLQDLSFSTNQYQQQPQQGTDKPLKLSGNHAYESQTVHNLIDKMIGPIDPRYQIPGSKLRQARTRGRSSIQGKIRIPLEEEGQQEDGQMEVEQLQQSQQQQQLQLQQQQSTMNEIKMQEATDNLQQEKPNLKTQQSEKSLSEVPEGQIIKQKDIDTFIQMLREHKPKAEEFIYLIKKEGHNHDAYNLKVVKYSFLTENKIDKYYTLSSKGVTRFENSMPVEFVHLGNWLTERDQFNAIKNLSFFKKFRKWKTLKKWTKIVFQNRSKQISEVLNQKLFILNEIYQKLLLKHKSLCYDFERLRFCDISESTDSLTAKDTQTLKEFADAQQKLRSDVVDKLEDYSIKLHENCRLGIKAVIDQLKSQIKSEMSSEEEQLNIQQQVEGAIEIGASTMDEKKQILTSLGFPENMSYGHRSMMRSEFVRFLRLAYLLDFITIQSLGNIYIYSAEDFLIRITKIAAATFQDNVLTHKEQDYNQEQDPLWLINFKFIYDSPLQVEESEILEVKYKDFKKDLTQFDLHEMIEFVPTKEELDEKFAKQNESKDKKDKEKEAEEEKKKLLLMQISQDYEEEDAIKRRYITNLEKCWLDLVPNKGEFVNVVQNIFSQGLDCIQVIERWSKNTQFEPYVKGLEEWDEIIGEKWTKPESYYLNPSHWIKEHEVSQTFLKSVIEVFDSQFERIDRFQSEYRNMFNLFWRELNSDVSVLSNSRLKHQTQIFEWSLTFFQDNTKIISDNLIPNVSLGLFKIQCGDIQHVLVPQHKSLVKKLEFTLVKIFQERGVEVLKWLQKYIKNLTGMVLKIEEFVDQKNALDQIYKELPEKREQLNIIEELVKLLVDKNVEDLGKEQKDLAHEIVSMENSLNVAINDAETSTAKNIDRFKKHLKDFTEKLKEESVTLMDLARQEKYLKSDMKQDIALQELELLDQKMKSAEENMKKYTEYEEILQVQETAKYYFFVCLLLFFLQTFF